MWAAIRRFHAGFFVVAQVAIVLAAVEWKHPYFFLQDDNRNQILPLLTHNWRAVSSGEIAQFDFHQFCGMPALASGQAQALYVPAYLAMAVSRLVWRSPYAVIDVLVWFHLLLGALGTYYCFRQFRLGRPAAAWAAAAAVLNSFVIYVGNSWPWGTAVAAWFPWALAFTIRFARGEPWEAAGLAIAHLLWFFNGHPELLLYGVLFETAIFAVMTRRLRVPHLRASAAWVGLGLATLALAAPLLLPMAAQTMASQERAAPMDWESFTAGRYSVRRWASGALLPFWEYPAQVTPEWRHIDMVAAYASHVGYATLALVLFGAYKLAARGSGDDRGTGFLLAVCAGVSFVWSLGALSPLLYHAPILNRMRWPFKLQFFTAFFVAAFAGWALDRLLAGRAKARSRVLAGALGVVTVINFGALYAGNPIRTFRRSASPLPAPEPLADRLRAGRVATVGYRWFDRDAPGSFGFNYATLWQVQSLAGYDPLVTRLNSRIALGLNHMASMTCDLAIANLSHLREWGVRHYIVSRAALGCDAELRSQGLEVVHRDEGRTVLRDAAAPSVVSWDSGDEGIACSIGINDATCEASTAVDRPLTMRFAAHPFFRVTVDGRAMPFARVRDRIEVRVPAGRHRVELRYRDPLFRTGLWIAAAGLLGVATAATLRRRGAAGGIMPAADPK